MSKKKKRLSKFILRKKGEKGRLNFIRLGTDYKDMPYLTYLKTEHWKRLKNIVKKRAGYKCEECGLEALVLNVHHAIYRGRGQERTSDLICLCTYCHDEEHGIKEKIPNWTILNKSQETLV